MGLFGPRIPEQDQKYTPEAANLLPFPLFLPRAARIMMALAHANVVLRYEWAGNHPANLRD